MDAVGDRLRVVVVLVVLAALAVGTVLARKLHEMRIDRTPMHTRYAVVVPGLYGWAVLTAPAWLRGPASFAHLLGAAGGVHLFVLGTVGFVVLGTLYHISPSSSRSGSGSRRHSVESATDP